MKEYNIVVPEFTEFEENLQKEFDFFRYMEFLKESLPNYLIIITVADTPAGPLFTKQHSACMRESLGLKIDLVKAFRQPYIAIIDRGNVVFEETLTDRTKPLILDGKLKNKIFSIYSGGFECDTEIGCVSSVTFDHISYYGFRGFNFFVYNTEKNYITDMTRFETFRNGSEYALLKPIYLMKKIINSFNNKIASGGVVCIHNILKLPPTPNGSVEENFIGKERFDYNLMLKDEKLLKTIWDQKLLQFVNDFDTLEDLKEAISTPESYIDIDGVLKFKDYMSNVVNTRNGIRITTDQPKKPKRAIFLVGFCHTFGIGAKDAQTPASYLQRKLNEYLPEENFIVYNYGYFIGGWENFYKLLPIIESLPVKNGDIVLIQYYTSAFGIPFCDLYLKPLRPHDYGEIYLDKGHYAANGNRMMADGIFDFLREHDFFKDAKTNFINAGELGDLKTGKNNGHELLTNYKSKLENFYKENIRLKVGAIVMSANPFTFGHRYLVEEALKNCDRLIVFVVEEDKLDISFEDRFYLVKENLKDLSNVFVMPSGEFIISVKTFSEYFRKESIQEAKIDTSLDVTLFAKEIAHCLDISVRFAGQEPMDKITAQYNEDMAKILPQYGIEFKEIPRKQTDNGEIISASSVRKLVKEGNFEKLKEFAPPATVEYLMKFI